MLVVILFVIFVVMIEVAVHIFDVPVYIFPSPRKIAFSILANANILVAHGAITIVTACAGFCLSILLGSIIAILMASSEVIRSVILPWLLLIKLTPVIAIAPLISIWFGYGYFPIIVISFLISFFPYAITLGECLNNIDTNKMHLMKLFGAHPYQILLKLKLPNALPFIFSGMKVSYSLSLIGSLLGEIICGDSGLGYLILVSKGQLDISLVFGIILITALMGLLGYLIISIIESRMLHYMPKYFQYSKGTY